MTDDKKNSRADSPVPREVALRLDSDEVLCLISCIDATVKLGAVRSAELFRSLDRTKLKLQVALNTKQKSS